MSAVLAQRKEREISETNTEGEAMCGGRQRLELCKTVSRNFMLVFVSLLFFLLFSAVITNIDF